MYESKKEAALKTLDKKQTKVDEIDKLLEEEILPTIEKLRKERGDYMKWASGNDALERLRLRRLRDALAQDHRREDVARVLWGVQAEARREGGRETSRPAIRGPLVLR